MHPLTLTLSHREREFTFVSNTDVTPLVVRHQRIRVMLQFILRRLGLVIPTFIGITLLTFAFVHMIPGDPVMIMAGERGISLSVMRNCWLNSALISQCGSSISTISGACCTVI